MERLKIITSVAMGEKNGAQNDNASTGASEVGEIGTSQDEVMPFRNQTCSIELTCPIKLMKIKNP